MKSLPGRFLFGMALWAATSAPAQEWVRDWSRIWGSASNDYGQAVAARTDGVVYVAGTTTNAFDGQTNAGFRNATLTAYDTAGAKQWTRVFGATNFTEGYAVAVDSTGAVYVAGQTWAGFDGQAAIGNGDAFLSKFAANGDTEWTRVFGSARIDAANGIAVDASNFVYVCGYCRTNFDGQAAMGGRDLFYSRFSPAGARELSRIWGGTNDEYAQSIAVDGLGHVFVAGYTSGAFDGQPFGGTTDACLSLFDGAGTKQWSRIWGGAGANYAYGVAADGLGNAYVAGHGGPFGDQAQIGDTDPFLCRYGEDGTLAWARIWGSIWSDMAYGVAVAGTNDIFVAGMASPLAAFDGQSSGDGTAYLSAFHADGSRPWTRRWGAGNTEARGVAALSPSNLFAAGCTVGAFDDQTSCGEYDLFLTRWIPDVPPVITSGPVADNLTRHEAEISWTTDRSCDSEVEVGLAGASNTWFETETNRASSHAVMLTNLQANTSYRYRARSTDASAHTVVSDEGTFETLPEPPVVSNLEIYGEAQFPWQIDVDQTGDISRVEFYFDDQLIYTDYSPPFDGGLFPDWAGLDMEDLVGTQQVSAVAYGVDGSTAMCAVDMSFLADYADLVEVHFVRPNDELTIYTATDTAPSTNIACRIYARQKTKTPRRPGGGWGPEPAGGESFVAVTQVTMSVNSTTLGLATNASAGGTSFYWDYVFNPHGLAIGQHRLGAMVNTPVNVDIGNSTRINVVSGLPDLVYERDVARSNSHFLVTLTLRNEGAQAASIDEVTDTLSALQPVLGECAAARDTNYAYQVSTRTAQVQFLFPANTLLDPGEELVLTYRAVPVMHRDVPPPRIGGDEARILYRDWQNTPRETSMNQIVRTAHVPGEEEAQFLEQAVEDARLASTYLMVSNPQNLAGLFGDGNGARVLTTMAHLAVLRDAVLGYYGSYQSMATPGHLTDPVAVGDVFNDGRDELVLADTEGERLRVYNGMQELTLASNRLPFACPFYPGDQVGVGNLIAKEGTNLHPRAEIAIANGGEGIIHVGRVDVYRYRPSLGDFYVQQTFLPYSNGCAFAVANVLYDGIGLDEMVVVQPNGALTVHSNLDATSEFSATVDYGPGCVVRTGNILGGSRDNVLVVRLLDARSWIYTLHEWDDHLESLAWDVEFEPDDSVTIADIWGDEKEEIIVARESEDRIQFYGYDAAARQIVLRGQWAFEFNRGDRLVSGGWLYHAREQIGIMRGETHGEHVAGHLEILVDPAVYGAPDADGLDRLLNAGGHWARRMSPAWVDDGYLLIVGETDIIPAFSAFWNLYNSDLGQVDTTDRNYASTGRDENDVPELNLGRIIGNSADALIAPLNTAVRFGPYLNGPGVSADALTVVGYSAGPDGDSDEIDFSETADLAEDELAGNGGYAGISRIYTPSLTTDYILSCMAAHNFVLIAGHGNWSSWDVLDRDIVNAYTNSNWNVDRPVIYAKSCLTGRYPPGQGFAESLLQKGAAAYIGATEITLNPWSMRMATAFATRLDRDNTLGSALKGAKLHRMSDGAQTYSYDLDRNRYHCAAFNLYGDPACRFRLPETRGAAKMALPPQQFEGPLATLDVQVPAYAVHSSNGLDTVTIPNGGDVYLPGMPAVPSYTASVHFPVGNVVQDVDLVSRGTALQNSSLNPPIVVPATDGAATSAPIPPWKSKAGDWWPDEEFAWSLVPETDGSTTLQVTMYPFYFNTNTAESLFYTNYAFAIAYATTDVAIVQLTPDSGCYQPGDTVRVEVYIHGSNAAPRNLNAVATLRSSSLETNIALPRVSLPAAQGLAAFTLEWDSAGHPAGNYILDVALSDVQSVVLSRRQLEFSLGTTAGELTQASLVPESFRRGEDLDLSATFENHGSTALNGVMVIQARHADGTVEAEFRQDFSNLLAGTTYTFSTVWSNATLVPRDCQIVAFALYGGNTSPSVAGYDWEAAPLLLDGLSAQSGNTFLRWPSVDGRTYDIELSTNALSSYFFFTNVTASSPQNTYTDLPPEEVLFYRVRERP